MEITQRFPKSVLKIIENGILKKKYTILDNFMINLKEEEGRGEKESDKFIAINFFFLNYEYLDN